MPLDRYGVLIGRAVASRPDGRHFQVQLADGAGTDHRVAVDVGAGDLLYLIDDDLRHPVTGALAGLGSGWHPLPHGPGGANLDYIRANLFDPAALRPLPPAATGPDNDLAALLDHYVQRAVADPSVWLYAYGQRRGPEPTTPDRVFGFRPGNGVTDLHMNQGSTGRFTADDGIWQDGGLLLHFPGEGRWVGVFVAFGSQVWHTDPAGHAVAGAPRAADLGAPPVRILAAAVKPAGSVLLLNASPAPVDLTGWRLADPLDNSAPLPPGPLPPGATLGLPVTSGVQLDHRGGSLTLLDAAGRKVTGVSYPADAARRDGWTIVF